MEVLGKVEAKGEKFNGSVKVNGKWLNFKKGFDHSHIKQGGEYLFILKDWEFQGKTGSNVVSATAVGDDNILNHLEEPKPVSKPVSKGRDFDAEARGKTRCQMFSAALQSPVIQQYLYTKEATLEDILKTLKEVADAGTAYTFGE